MIKIEWTDISVHSDQENIASAVADRERSETAMAIQVNLRKVLKERGVKSRDLAACIGITEANLSRLVTGKARAVRFSTLDAICRELDCGPGDILSQTEEDEM